MSIEISKQVSPNHEPRDIQTAIIGAWDEIVRLRSLPTHVPEEHIATQEHTLSQSLRDTLRNAEESPGDHRGNKAYHELKFILASLTALVNIPRSDTLSTSERTFYANILQHAATQTCNDILSYFRDGAWFHEQGSLIGLLNEVTPVGVYTTDKRLLTRSTYQQDMKEKTDIVTYEYDRDGTHQATTAVQCKTSLYSSRPEKGIVFLSARDFGNKQDISRGIMHDNETSQLLVDRNNGLLSDEDTDYLRSISDKWDDLVTERLSARHRHLHEQRHENYQRSVGSLVKIKAMATNIIPITE